MKVTQTHIARGLKEAFSSNPKPLKDVGSRVQPTMRPPLADEFIRIVEQSDYNSPSAYSVLYVSYWNTTSITSALMFSPHVLEWSYLCDAQVKRMAKAILHSYKRAVELINTSKTIEQ